MCDLIYKYKIWEHSRIMTGLNLQRAKGEAPVQTCVEQLHDVLEPLVQPGWSLLDAGCGVGHYYHFLKDLGIEYRGVDFTKHYIEMGREHLPKAGLSADRLEVGCVENIDGRADVVICFNMLLYCPDFRQPLERMCEAADRYFVLRTLLGDEEERRYVRDGYLDEGWNNLKAYFNIYSLEEVKEWIASHGFEVSMLVDRRTNDEPECVNDMPHPWRFLLARRVSDDRDAAKEVLRP